MVSNCMNRFLIKFVNKCMTMSKAQKRIEGIWKRVSQPLSRKMPSHLIPSLFQNVILYMYNPQLDLDQVSNRTSKMDQMTLAHFSHWNNVTDWIAFPSERLEMNILSYIQSLYYRLKLPHSLRLSIFLFQNDYFSSNSLSWSIYRNVHYCTLILLTGQDRIQFFILFGRGDSGG